MSRTPHPPRYSLHKASGQARVILNGKHHYLGPYGSKDSKERYARLIMEHVSAPAVSVPATQEGFPDLLICELLVQYFDHASRYYTPSDVTGGRGQRNGELANIRDAMRPLRALYDTTRARDFGPRSLKAVQNYMVDVEDLSRKVVNARIKRIRHMFKWAVSEELLPAHVYEALATVEGLRFGRTHARETPPVMPVDDAVVEATLAYLPPIVVDMVRVQRLTGMRPGDVVVMRPCDINRGSDVWVYEPPQHKTAYLGHRRQIVLGPRARSIVEPYLTNRSPHAYLFSPAEVQAWRLAQKALQPSRRRTPLYPSEQRRVEAAKRARRQRTPRKQAGPCYTTTSYYRAIQYALDQAKRAGVVIERWHPNQLRHARATEVRRQHGLEAAQVTLGHRQADITQVYAERNLSLARVVAEQSG